MLSTFLCVVLLNAKRADDCLCWLWNLNGQLKQSKMFWRQQNTMTKQLSFRCAITHPKLCSQINTFQLKRGSVVLWDQPLMQTRQKIQLLHCHFQTLILSWAFIWHSSCLDIKMIACITFALYILFYIYDLCHIQLQN